MRLIHLLTHKPLRLVVPQRRSPQAVCNQRKEGLFHLEEVRKMEEKSHFDCFVFLESSSGTHLERGIKYDQFTAGWNGVVAAVALHEVHVDGGVGLCVGTSFPRR